MGNSWPAERLPQSRRWVWGAVYIAIAALAGWFAGHAVGIFIAVIVGGAFYLIVTWDPVLRHLPVLRRLRRTVVSAESAGPSSPSAGSTERVGLRNRQGGVADVSHASFGEGLDTAIDNQGEVNASHAKIGSKPKEPK